MDTCRICNHQIIPNYNRGHSECKNCGFIIDYLIDISQEYQNSTEAGKSNTCITSGAIDDLLPQSSMSSYLVGKGNNSVKRLQLWGRVPSKERSLLLVFERMRQLFQYCNIDNCVYNDARVIYYELYMRIQAQQTFDFENSNHEESGAKQKKNVLSRGINRDGLIAYIMLLACEKNKLLFTRQSICELFNISESVFRAGKKKYHDLYLKQCVQGPDISHYTLTNYMERFLPFVNFTPQEQKMCFVVSKRIEHIRLMKNRQPVSAAASLIYFMSQLMSKGVSKSFISQISDKSEPTITKIYTLLLANKQFIIPLEFQKHLKK